MEQLCTSNNIVRYDNKGAASNSPRPSDSGVLPNDEGCGAQSYDGDTPLCIFGPGGDFQWGYTPRIVGQSGQSSGRQGIMEIGDHVVITDSLFQGQTGIIIEFPIRFGRNKTEAEAVTATAKIKMDPEFASEPTREFLIASLRRIER